MGYPAGMVRYPAVMIGGPPDSGKSVLTANLTQALRERGVQHYVLRACPDGEGDWTYLADQSTVRTIHVQQTWTHEFVDLVCRDLEHPHLPLIVDAGGRPQPWQEIIFSHCTHAILLTRDAASRREWLERAARHRLALLADIDSRLHGETQMVYTEPHLRGTLAGLRWTRASQNKRTARTAVTLRHPLFLTLVERLAQLFDHDEVAIRQAHLDAAPVETVVDLERLARALRIPHRGEQAHWLPDHLPAVLDYLPDQVPLGLYGRGPNWLYAALALLAHPAEVWQYDARLGWVRPARTNVRTAGPGDPRLRAAVTKDERCTFVSFDLPLAYLDYLDAEGLPVPAVDGSRGLILSGKLPHWLLTGLALAYRQACPDAPWLAVYHPQLEGAVVVWARAGMPALGSVYPCAPPTGAAA